MARSIPLDRFRSGPYIAVRTPCQNSFLRQLSFVSPEDRMASGYDFRLGSILNVLTIGGQS
jgi:hypothetical protein